MNDETPAYQDIDKGLADLELKVKNSNRALDNLFKGLGIGAEERAGAVPPQVYTGDPSQSLRRLADACIAQGAQQVFCVEQDPNYASTLNNKGYPTLNADFLTVPPSIKYSRVVMNPPFSGGQFIQHIQKALEWLAPGGALVSVIPGGKDQPKLAQALAGRQFVVTPLDQGAFKSSGTAVATSVVIVKG
jgi:hypothetical protein